MYLNENSAELLYNARLLIEAASEQCDSEELEEVKDLLDKASDKLDDVIEDDDKKVDEKTKAVVESAIAALYEKAALTESAELADACIEKAEELQQAIDDIPEETPEDDDEYPADVNGGEGEKIDQEELKDIVGDNNLALKLLNTDVGSAVVDA